MMFVKPTRRRNECLSAVKITISASIAVAESSNNNGHKPKPSVVFWLHYNAVDTSLDYLLWRLNTATRLAMSISEDIIQRFIFKEELITA